MWGGGKSCLLFIPPLFVLFPIYSFVQVHDHSSANLQSLVCVFIHSFIHVSALFRMLDYQCFSAR